MEGNRIRLELNKKWLNRGLSEEERGKEEEYLHHQKKCSAERRVQKRGQEISKGECTFKREMNKS